MALSITTVCTEKWKLDKLDSLIDSAEDAVADAVRNRKEKEDENYTNIILRAFGKSVVTMREILCLATLGYPDGALSLARNMYEQFISVCFFESHKHDADFDNYIRDYYYDYDIQRCKSLKYEAEKLGNHPEVTRLEQELATIKQRTHRNVTHQDYWWTGKGTLSNIAESLQIAESDPDFKKFLARLHFAYKRACVAIHSNCLGNYLRLGTDKDFTGIDTRPRTTGHELPLYLATCSMIMIAGVSYKILDIPKDRVIKELNELAAFYNNPSGGKLNNA